MIVTVCMNPAIDKTVEIEEMVHGGLNRIRKVEKDAGGKGINVSKTIAALGGTSTATGFLGGSAGKVITDTLKELGIANDFVEIDGETRTNMKVFENDGTVTELNEPGSVITEEQLAQLMEKIDGYAEEGTLFVLSGSIPKGVPKDIYAQIIRRVKAKGAAVLLDADGELFRNALTAGPDMIKPNHVELEEYAGLSENASEAELCAAVEALRAKGIRNTAVSMGKEGALFLLDGYEVRCPALSVKAHSTVGAGDAMVAALSLAWEKKLSAEETVCLCMAASAGAVMTIGTKPPTLELVTELKKQVKICPLQEREAGVRRLYRNLVDSVKESEIKLGYDYGALRLFYPLATLNHLLQLQVSAAEMQKVLEAFAGCEKETLGALEISAAGERFSVLVPAEGVKYVHEHVEASEFLKELVSQTAAHGCSLEKAEAVFHRYSDQVVCKKMDHGEFDEVLYFADGKPDDYLYCLHEEGGHITYHRFDREDYQDFGF